MKFDEFCGTRQLTVESKALVYFVKYGKFPKGTDVHKLVKIYSYPMYTHSYTTKDGVFNQCLTINSRETALNDLQNSEAELHVWIDIYLKYSENYIEIQQLCLEKIAKYIDDEN